MTKKNNQSAAVTPSDAKNVAMQQSVQLQLALQVVSQIETAIDQVKDEYKVRLRAANAAIAEAQ